MENNQIQSKTKKSLLENTFFVILLFFVGLVDFIYRASHNTYSILNISFVILSFLLVIKTIRQNKKSKT